MCSFTEIGEELGVSKQRAKQIYDNAINKLSSSRNEESMNDLQDVLDELAHQSPMHETMSEAVHQQGLTEGHELDGFWKEENNH